MLETETLHGDVEQGIISGQSGLWINSHQPEEALLSVVQLAKDYAPDWELQVWDVIKGLQQPGQEDTKQGGLQQKQSALAAVQAMISIAEQRQVREIDEKPLPEDDRNLLLILRNGHREISNNGAVQKEMLMALQHLIGVGKAHKCHVLIFSFPGVMPPLELQEQVWVIEHKLPNIEERKELLVELLEASELAVPEDIDEVAKACGGLTHGQVEGVASLSIMKHDAIKHDVVFKMKGNIINKRGLLTLDQEPVDFSMFGGYPGVKKWLKMALRPGMPEHIRARAVLLLGVPGVGKSHLAKALGVETNRASLRADFGRLMGSLVGQSEGATREMYSVADAMEPANLFVDEIEKALGNATSSNDSGVSARMFGSTLEWLNDHKSDVFFIATANNISMLPPEFTRAERFDAIWFMDLPSREAKDAIWDIYLKFYGLDVDQERPDDKIWTGAEIKACCRQAAMFDVPVLVTAQQVVPVMLTAKESIEQLREWAHMRCLDAETGLMYSKDGPLTDAAPTVVSTGTKRTRKVTRRAKTDAGTLKD
jgi:hypothetical protein